MKLSEGERILKVYHHHPTPFVFNVLKVILGTFPFLLLLFLFESLFSTKAFIFAHLILFFVFSLIIVYISFIYWLDKLVITDKRVVYINWKYLTVREEAEALINDIQDIRTKENGFLSNFWIFDYGKLRIDTPSSYVIVEFYNAPDPEEIRKYIFHIKSQ